MLSKVVLWTILIAPWFTLFFLKREDIKRFMPVAILAAFLMVLYNLIAHNQKHWIIKESILPWLKPSFASGILGAFLIVTIWIFYFTYGKFWIYLVTNIVLDFMFAIFPVHFILQEKLKIYQLLLGVVFVFSSHYQLLFMVTIIGSRKCLSPLIRILAAYKLFKTRVKDSAVISGGFFCSTKGQI